MQALRPAHARIMRKVDQHRHAAKAVRDSAQPVRRRLRSSHRSRSRWRGSSSGGCAAPLAGCNLRSHRTPTRCVWRCEWGCERGPSSGFWILRQVG